MKVSTALLIFFLWQGNEGQRRCKEGKNYDQKAQHPKAGEHGKLTNCNDPVDQE